MTLSTLFKKPLAVVAFNMRPAAGPWGGSSPFVVQLGAFLKQRGYAVTYALTANVDAVVLIDPRPDLQNRAFGLDEIRRHRERHPGLKVLHRINECDRRKGTAFMDRMLAEANQLADHTVFISAWLRDYHLAQWFAPARPHSVIYNGADARHFHPIGNRPWCEGQPFRIVTHHWSDHPLKGFDVYAEVDQALAAGELPGVEFWVIGRWPETIRWQAARTFPPLRGRALADRLRACHAYLTASRWEPCGMHHVEGAQCGLPLIYHADGGGIVEAGLQYGVGFTGDVKSAILAARDRYAELRRRLFESHVSGDRMCYEYARVLERLLCS